MLEAALSHEGGIDEAQAAAALAQLEQARMTLDLLAESGVGKLINQLRKSTSSLAARAKALYERWKAMASS